MINENFPSIITLTHQPLIRTWDLLQIYRQCNPIGTMKTYHGKHEVWHLKSAISTHIGTYIFFPNYFKLKKIFELPFKKLSNFGKSLRMDINSTF